MFHTHFTYKHVQAYSAVYEIFQFQAQIKGLNVYIADTSPGGGCVGGEGEGEGVKQCLSLPGTHLVQSSRALVLLIRSKAL